MAVQRHPDPVADHAVHRADHHLAVDVGPPRVDVFRDPRRVPGEVHHHPVGGQHALQPQRLAELGVLAQVPVLAVHRDQDLRLDQPVHLLQVGAVRVARDVVGAALVVDDVDALLGQHVHDPDHPPLVAGDRLGGEQEGVALLQLDAEVLALRQLGRGRAPLGRVAQNRRPQARRLGRRRVGYRGALT